MRRAGAVLLAALVVAACGNGGGDADRRAARSGTPAAGDATTTLRDHAGTAATSTTTATATRGTAAASKSDPTKATRDDAAAVSGGADAPAAAGALAAVGSKVKATKLATLAHPTALAARPGETTTMYVATKDGTVRRLRVATNRATVDTLAVLDIRDKVSTGGEQGLLGITFSANGATLYAAYTDTGGTIRVVAYPFNGRAVADGERDILTVAHPQYDDHNGGQVSFGPDGHLYVGLGDGGGVGDPYGNAQNLGSLLGKILRITPNPGGGYTVPADNPFARTPGARGEIWHYGLRNPWRWSFDRANGELWIGDVGQNAYEEINHVGAGVRGANFGWNKREGAHAYNGAATPDAAVDPQIEMTHDDGNCAVTGGYVYRGSAIKGLGGVYLFADYCKEELVGALGAVTRELGVHVNEPASFGEDATGELWVLSQSGGVFRLDPR